MLFPGLHLTRRGGDGAAVNRFTVGRRLAHFLWLCLVVSPFSTRAQILEGIPEPLSWELLIAAASAHFVLPSVFPCLAAKDLLDLAPRPAREALEELYLQNCERSRERADQVERISRVLNQAGIEPLWLKGAALLISGSKWAPMRMLSDLDFWVPPEALTDAVNALGAIGYAHRPEYGEDHGHHIAALFHDAEPMAIEVHFSIGPPEQAAILPTEPVVERAQSIEWRGVRLRIPSLPDQIVHFAAQSTYYKWSLMRGRPSARRPHDFVLLCAEYGAAASVELVRNTYRHGGEAELAEEFLSLAGALFDLPGNFAATEALNELIFRVRSPSLHALRLSYRALANKSAISLFTQPGGLAKKVVRHFRNAVKQDW